MTALPDVIRRLFWDVDPGTVDLDAHQDYVIERVMSRGGWAAMKWLRATYDIKTLVHFLERRGQRLAPRERAYWSLVARVEVVDEPGGGRPRWATA